MENIIRDIEKEKLMANSKRLNQHTSNLFNKQNKKIYQEQIKQVSDENLDEIHLKFHNANNNLTFEETLLVKKYLILLKVVNNET